MARQKTQVSSGMPQCEWTPDDDGIYHTACGNMFCFTDDGPVENKMHFCCYCGAGMHAEPVNLRSAMRLSLPPVPSSGPTNA